MGKFLRAYIKSMRPYTFFITGIAGLIGMLLVKSSVSILQQVIVLVLLFSSYGVNQIINDLLGLREDKWNAPLRPSISGELDKRNAIITTFIIVVLGAIITFFFNPYALIIYCVGYLFSILYEYIKGIPVIGQFWFGFLISLATIYGALAITNQTLFQILNNADLMYMALLVMLSSATMCYFTYFKDYLGDKKEGKKTLIVLLTPNYARKLNFLMSLLPFIVLLCICYFNLWSLRINSCFLILTTIAFILSQYTSLLYYKRHNNSDKEKSNLELNFESTVLFQVSLIALVNPLLAVILFIFSFLMIKIIFTSMYKKNLY